MASRRSPDEIERAIERDRARVVTDVEALQVAVRDRLDWRARVRERPLIFVGAAFAVGFWLGWR